MIIACWSPKGGTGTTVVSAALGLLLARSLHTGAVVVDLAGDVPAVLGMCDADGEGVREWLAADDTVRADALARLEVPAPDGLSIVPCGRVVVAPRPGRADALVAALDDAFDDRAVVVDCGTLGPSWSSPDPVAVSVAAAATLSLAVLRPCYLALRRAVAAPVRPSGVVLVNEPQRVLGRADVEGVLGVPVRAELHLEPAVARAVDAGLLSGRLPRGLERALRDAA